MGVCRCPIVRQTRHSELLHPVPILRCHMSRDRQRTPLVAVAPKSTGLLSYDQWCMFHFCLFGSMSNPSTWLSYECLKNFLWWYDQEKQKKELLCLYLSVCTWLVLGLRILWSHLEGCDYLHYITPSVPCNEVQSESDPWWPQTRDSSHVILHCISMASDQVAVSTLFSLVSRLQQLNSDLLRSWYLIHSSNC